MLTDIFCQKWAPSDCQVILGLLLVFLFFFSETIETTDSTEMVLSGIFTYMFSSIVSTEIFLLSSLKCTKGTFRFIYDS